MYSYDRRKTAASMDAHAKWRDIIRKHEKAEREELDALVKEMAKYLKSEGLELDVRKSYLEKDYHGSDGYRLTGALIVSESKENNVKVTDPQWIRKWVEAATGLYGFVMKTGEGPALRQVDDLPVGVWEVTFDGS